VSWIESSFTAYSSLVLNLRYSGARTLILALYEESLSFRLSNSDLYEHQVGF
jgi:hypothetical protein